jgi:fructose-1,6-bisphosphatase I
MASAVDMLVGEGRRTLTQFILEEHRRLEAKGVAVSGEFTALLTDIATACKVISMLVNKGPKLGVLGAASTQNVQGEEQKTLDVLSDTVFRKANEYGGWVAGMVSEELPDFYPIPAQYPKGKYLLCFDPLDGSSNIEVNVSVGTIFAIFEMPEGKTEVDNEVFLQEGNKIVGAGYCVYGPQTTLVFSTGNGVNGFCLDQDVGEFYLAYQNMRVPEDTKEYAINASNRRHWDAPILRYIEEVEAGTEGPRRKDFNMRWVGSMVADVHRILTRGGVFMYPDDAKLRKSGLKGRLRYLYEVAPMAYLMEQAGGAATTGHQRALDIVPEQLHERTPVILGSKNEVILVEKYFAEHADGDRSAKKART